MPRVRVRSVLRIVAALILVYGSALIVVPFEWWPWWAVLLIGGTMWGLWRTRSDDDPAPPRNVRLVLDDDTVVPCDCVYSGRHDGLNVWTVVTELPTQRVVSLTADAIPGHTTIQLPMS